jgi:sarcosine oxidase
MKVVVVGVGGLGAAVVHALAERGAEVVGLERFVIPHERGSSFGETRVIRNGYFESPRYVPLLQRAWALWRARSREHERTSGEPLLRETGVLHVGPPEHAAMRALLASVHAHALPHEIVDRARVRAFGITPGPDDVGVFEDQGGFLYVERCTRAFVARARERGARIVEQARVTAIETRADGVEVRAHCTDLVTGREHEERVRADHVIVCGGAWSPHDPALAPHFAHVPLVVTRQPQLWFTPPDVSSDADVALPPAFIHFVKAREDGGAFYGIPPARAGGPMKVCLHHAGPRVHPDEVVRTTTDEDFDAVRGYVRAHLPQLGPLFEARICMYTSTPDEHFVIGPSPVDARVTLASACSGHGYKMTIVLAEALAQRALDGHTPHDLGLFAPSRFAGRAH